MEPISMPPKNKEFPILASLDVPVFYNYAGVPFVTWFDLKAALRSNRWESLFVREVEKITPISNGYNAHEVENKLQTFKQRLE